MLDRPHQMMQRTRGRAHVGLLASGGHTNLQDLRQAGSAKAFLPRCYGAMPEVVFLNTAGGVTGGDHLEFALDLGPGARAMATTQTAERAYKTTGDAGRIDVKLSVGDGGRLDWLPQETILFENSYLSRDTRIDLHGSAELITVETLVLGRAAMGERPRGLHLRDRRQVFRDGVPQFIEPVTLTPDDFADRDNPAGLAGGWAMATVGVFAPNAPDRAVTVTPHTGVRMEQSGWDGRLIVRLMAVDAWALRQTVVEILRTLRGGDLPRVWQT